MKNNNPKTSRQKLNISLLRCQQNNKPALKESSFGGNVEKNSNKSQSTNYRTKEYRNLNRLQYTPTVPSIQKESTEVTARQIPTKTDKKSINDINNSLYFINHFENPQQEKLKSSFSLSQCSTINDPYSKDKKKVIPKQERSKTLEDSTLNKNKGMLDTFYERSLKIFKPIALKYSDLVISTPEVVNCTISANVCPKLKDIVGYEVNEAIFDRNLKDFIIPELKIPLKKHESDFLVTRKHVIKLDPFYRTSFNANINKCRYKDVYCLEKTRVRLQSTPGSVNDFIHANYVSVRDYIDNYKMICAQGPLPSTIIDFWRMIIQEKCQNIVMLTQCFETVGKMPVKKCEQYWPLEVGESMTYGNIKIRNIKVTKLSPDIQVSDLEVKDDTTSLNTSHIIMANWPDKSTPKVDFTMFILLQQLVRTSPSVVHCSAGIGRTGTLAVIDMIMARLSIDCPPISLAAMVQNLRLYRHGAVQTESQFSYVIQVMLQLAQSRGIISEKDIATWYMKNELPTGVNSKR
uniref:Uncharacterized protein n=1 Tax=Strongyloides venezuelensis TaxID=75913 RepID=A0A0K0FPK5_STRVS